MARLALHAMTFGNARAVALLWLRFVRELRFAHWDALTLLPRMQHQPADRSALALFYVSLWLCHAVGSDLACHHPG